MQLLWIAIGAIARRGWRGGSRSGATRRWAADGAESPHAPPAPRRCRAIRCGRELFALFFRVGALNELQYRANFAVQLFQSVIALGDRASPCSGWSSARRRTSTAGPSPSCSP